MKADSLGDRMKGYENISRNHLVRRVPVVIRLDGKAFHTLTRGMDRPFDDRLIKTMQETTQALVKNIEGCSFGYTQSDEISLLLTDYKNIETQAWFDYNVQKMTSVAASMCTAYFNGFFVKNFLDAGNGKVAFFDARAFNVPKDEVVNCFIWRQQDCTRNSIQMVGRAHFSHKELDHKSCDDIQEMLFSQKGINWNDTETFKKRGTCVYKRSVCIKDGLTYNLDDKEGYPKSKEDRLQILGNPTIRTEYVIDKESPIFTQDRNYIQKWVDVDKE
jgi:tRNA(His) 5'-end guanylyltransferase